MRYDAGAFPGSPVSRGLLVGLAPYKLANLHAEGYDVVTNKPRVAAYRAPGGTPAGFAVDSLMDELAETLDIDPLEFRRRNAAEEGDICRWECRLNRVGLRQMLDQIATTRAGPSRWKGPIPTGAGSGPGYWIGGSFTSSAEIKINPD